MAQDNSKISDVLKRIQSQNSTSASKPSQPKSSGGGYAAYLAAKNAPTNDAKNLGQGIWDSSTNIFGATLRLLTGLGRGVTNAAYDIMGVANKTWDQVAADNKFGIEDVPKILFGGVEGAFAGVGGLVRGIAGSAPGTEQAVEQLTGRPVIENWYELLKSNDFAQSAKNIPALKALSSDEQIPGTMKIGAFPVTPAGVTSFALDVLTDPASFATLGLAGALKGGASGVKQVAAAERAVRAGEKIDPALYAPKNVYTGAARPEPKVTAADYLDRNAAGYIFRNMGYGFTDAHRLAIDKIVTKRAAKKEAKNNIADSVLEDVAKQVDANPNITEEELLNSDAFKVDLIQAKFSSGKKADTKDLGAEEIEKELSKLRGVVGEIYAKAPAGTLTRTERNAQIKEIATQRGAQNVQVEGFAKGSEAVAAMRQEKPLVTKLKTGIADDPKLFEAAGAGIRDVSMGRLTGETASIGAAWSGFKNASARDRRSFIDVMFLPPGYREVKAKLASKEESTVGHFWGLDLLAGKRGKAKAQDQEFKSVREHITGTGLTRAGFRRIESAEMRAIQGKSKAYSDIVFGAGSETTKSKRMGGGTERAALEYLDNQLALGKAYYDLEYPDKTVPWEQVDRTQKAQIIDDLLNNPDLITPEMLDSIPMSPSLAAQRLEFFAERAQVSITKEYETLQKLAARGYNPMTELGKHLRTSDMLVKGKDRKGKIPLSQVLKSIRTATGLGVTSEARKLLKEVGVPVSKLRKEGELSFRSPEDIEEILKQSAIKTARREYEAQVRELTNDLKSDFPELEESINKGVFSEKLTPEQKAQIDSFAAAATEIPEEKIQKIMDTLRVSEDEIAKAKAFLELHGIDYDGRGAALKAAALYRGRMFTREGKASKSLADLKKLSSREFLGDIPKDDGLSFKTVFGKSLESYKKLVELPEYTAEVKDAARQIIQILERDINSTLVLSQGDIASYRARINTIIKDTIDKNARGRIPLFDDVFTKDNKIDSAGVRDFVIRAYRASKSPDSLDEGLFADYIEQKLKANGFVITAATKKTDIEGNIGTFAKTWDGEGTTLQLLQDVMRDAAPREGTEKIKTFSAGKLNRADSLSILEDISGNPQTGEFGYVRKAQDIIAADMIRTQRTEAAVRKLEQEQGNLADVEATNKLIKVIAENDAEESLAREAIGNADYILSEQAGETLTKLLAAPGGFDSLTVRAGTRNPFKLIGKDGKPVPPTGGSIVGAKLDYKTAKEGFDFNKDALDLKELQAKALELKAAKQDTTLIAQKIEQIKEIIRLKRQLQKYMYSVGQRNAINVVERARSQEILDKVWPKWASEEALLEEAKRAGNILEARANVRAKIMLATQLAKIDNAIVQADFAAAGSRKSGDIKKERESFGNMLGKLQGKVFKATSQGPINATAKQLEDVTLDDFAPNGKHVKNTQLLIQKVKTFEIKTSKDKETWAALVKLLQNATLEDATGAQRWANLDEFFNSYKQQEPNAPTLEETIKVLDAMGSADASEIAARLRAGLKPGINRRTVLRLVDDAANGKLNLDEAMPTTTYAEDKNIAGAQDVDEVLTQMAPAEEIQNNANERYFTMLEELTASGDQDIIMYATMMRGRSLNEWVLQRKAESVREIRDKLGRSVDTDTKKMGEKGFFMLRSFEPQPQYTGYKPVIKALSEQAKALDLEVGSAERAQWLDLKLQKIHALNDLEMLRHGIAPSINIKLTNSEGKPIGLFEEDGAYAGMTKEVYLSIGDVKNSLPEEARALLFYSGSASAFPETAMMPAVRLAVGMRSMLPEGEKFPQEVVDYLVNTMYKVTFDSIKETSVKEGAKISIYALDPQGTLENISNLIKLIMEPDRLDNLYAQHVINAGVSQKILRHKTSAVTKSFITKLNEIYTNPLSSTGDKLQATVEFTESINSIVKNQKFDGDVRLAVEHDFNAALIANLTADDFKNFQTEIARFNETITPEMATVLKKPMNELNKKQRQIRVQILNDQSKATQNALMLAYQDIVAKHGPQTYEDGLDMVFTEAVDAGKKMYDHKWVNLFDRAGERMFYAWGADRITPGLAGPLNRSRAEAVAQFNEHIDYLDTQYKQMPEGAEILKKAFTILKGIPEKEFIKAFAADIRVREAIQSRSKEKLMDAEEMLGLHRQAKLLKKYVDNSDPVMMKALGDVGLLVQHLFGGGKHSLVMSAGLDPEWLNRYIVEVGGAKYIEAAKFTGKDAEAIAASWREWGDLENPLDAMKYIHSALKSAEVIPAAAANLTREIGVLKTQFGSEAEAKAAGYASLGEGSMYKASSKESGTELIYFMDTDNYYFPAVLVPEIKQAAKTISEVKFAEVKGSLETAMNKFDSIQNFAKRFMTVMRPGNQVQNTLGGQFASYLGGMSPKVMALRHWQAFKILKSRNHLTMQKVQADRLGLNEDQWRKLALQNEQVARENGLIAKPSSSVDSKVFETKMGTYSYEEIFDSYKKHGGLVPTSATFDPVEGPLRQQKTLTGIKKAISRQWESLTLTVGRGSARRDDLLRLAYCIDVIKKEGGKNLDEAMKKAIIKTDRIHPQMQDLSTFNQRFTKHYVMFFTWRAKTLGWLLTDILDRPGRILGLQRAQMAAQQEQGQEVSLGDLTPKNMPLPSYMQNDLSNLIQTDTGLYSYSLANPVNDLLGARGWLSQISVNNYEPLETQALRITNETFANFIATSEPVFIGALIDWEFKKQTYSGSKLDYSVPPLIEDITSRLGLQPYHVLLASLMPDTFKRSAWKTMGGDQITQDQQLQLINWLSGIRLKQADTPKSRQKAVSELMERLRKQQDLGG
jgi:hypothetical protein